MVNILAAAQQPTQFFGAAHVRLLCFQSEGGRHRQPLFAERVRGFELCHYLFQRGMPTLRFFQRASQAK
jgi:hypothetical protein